MVHTQVRKAKRGLKLARETKAARKVSCTTSSAQAASPSLLQATLEEGCPIAFDKDVEQLDLAGLHASA